MEEKVNIHGVISKELYDQIKKRHISYSELLYMGLQMVNGMPGFSGRFEGIEKQLSNLYKRQDNVNLRVQKLELKQNEVNEHGTKEK